LDVHTRQSVEFYNGRAASHPERGGPSIRAPVRSLANPQLDQL